MSLFLSPGGNVCCKKYFATHDLGLSARISVKRNIALDRPPNWTYIVCDKRGFECSSPEYIFLFVYTLKSKFSSWRLSRNKTKITIKISMNKTKETLKCKTMKSIYHSIHGKLGSVKILVWLLRQITLKHHYLMIIIWGWEAVMTVRVTWWHREQMSGKLCCIDPPHRNTCARVYKGFQGF